VDLEKSGFTKLRWQTLKLKNVQRSTRLLEIITLRLS
jgi:hypothetical protein